MWASPVELSALAMRRGELMSCCLLGRFGREVQAPSVEELCSIEDFALGDMEKRSSELSHHSDQRLVLLLGLEASARLVPSTCNRIGLNLSHGCEVEILA